MQIDKPGRTVASRTVRLNVRRALNKSAIQLSEAVLAKALQGDSTAQLAAVQLLALGLAEPSTGK
jgi:hypothetical protein